MLKKSIRINMSDLYFLPAQHGDAFFLHCQKGDEDGWIVVDGGPSRKKNQRNGGTLILHSDKIYQ